MAWCHVPGTDCPSAQAAEALIWASCSPSPAITPALRRMGGLAPNRAHRSPARGVFRPGPDLGRPAQLRRPALPRGVRPSSPDIPASPSAPPANAAGPTIPATSGPTSPGSSGNASPNGCFSKTSPATSPSGSRPSCESFGDWATRLRRVCSARQRSARRISGCASSSWPTPMSLHPGTASYNPAGNSDFTRKAEALALGIAKAMSDQWPTPAAQNWKGSSPASVTRADGKSRMDILHYRAEQGFTRPDPATCRMGSDPRRTPRSRARSGLR